MLRVLVLILLFSIPAATMLYALLYARHRSSDFRDYPDYP